MGVCQAPPPPACWRPRRFVLLLGARSRMGAREGNRQFLRHRGRVRPQAHGAGVRQHACLKLPNLVYRLGWRGVLVNSGIGGTTWTERRSKCWTGLRSAKPPKPRREKGFV